METSPLALKKGVSSNVVKKNMVGRSEINFILFLILFPVQVNT
jgi:hypothetical protein